MIDIHSLPSELLHIIVEQLPDNDILSLCRVNSYYHTICCDVAYRRIKSCIGCDPAYHGNNCLWMLQAYQNKIHDLLAFNTYAASYLYIKYYHKMDKRDHVLFTKLNNVNAWLLSMSRYYNDITKVHNNFIYTYIQYAMQYKASNLVIYFFNMRTLKIETLHDMIDYAMISNNILIIEMINEKYGISNDKIIDTMNYILSVPVWISYTRENIFSYFISISDFSFEDYKIVYGIIMIHGNPYLIDMLMMKYPEYN